MGRVRRRELLWCAAGVLLFGPIKSIAQQPAKIRRIGVLTLRPRPAASNADDFYNAFLQGLRELGYLEDKNLVIEWRSADGNYDRLPGLAAELVKLKVEVIAAASTPSVQAVQRASSTIPVVAISVADPVSSGLAASLARPGGNITGLSNITADISPKLVELIKGVTPTLSRVAVLANPGNSTRPIYLENIQTAAKKIGMAIVQIDARTPEDIERGFALMLRERAEALIVMSDSFFSNQRTQIAKLAIKNRLPSVFPFREDALAGGLMSYGPSLADMFRRAATFVDKILKGAKPSELPFEQPTQFELVVNLRTAKALGIKFPQSILARADRMIE